MNRNILVTGGAGYIGSFIVRDLKNKGFNPVIIDNLASGHKEAVKGFPLYKLDLTKDAAKLGKLFIKEKFLGVIHMASYIQMGESFTNPGKYFLNNIDSTLNLLETMVKNKVRFLIFSSSAGVYGTPTRLPIKENDPKNPENPYGETKLMIEKILGWYDKAYSLKSISIRYFNAAGASLDGKIGEDHPNESHIIPLMIKSLLEKKVFNLFGNDYKTKDGTCIRDYVHVLDLSRAHTLALSSLIKGSKSKAFNVGSGKGYSNLEILKEIEKTAGELKWQFQKRRPGDAHSLYASTHKIKKELGWKPQYTLKEIISSAYLWHKKNPKGYSG